MYICHIPISHTVSFVVSPAVFTSLSAQVLCFTHSVLSSSLALNVPAGQFSHFASFVPVLGTNFLPAAHFVTVANTTNGVIGGRGVCVCVCVCV